MRLFFGVKSVVFIFKRYQSYTCAEPTTELIVIIQTNHVHVLAKAEYARRLTPFRHTRDIDNFFFLSHVPFTLPIVYRRSGTAASDDTILHVRGAQRPFRRVFIVRPPVIIVRVERERKSGSKIERKRKINRVIENLDHAAVDGRCARSCER